MRRVQRRQRRGDHFGLRRRRIGGWHGGCFRTRSICSAAPPCPARPVRLAVRRHADRRRVQASQIVDLSDPRRDQGPAVGWPTSEHYLRAVRPMCPAGPRPRRERRDASDGRQQSDADQRGKRPTSSVKHGDTHGDRRLNGSGIPSTVHHNCPACPRQCPDQESPGSRQRPPRCPILVGLERPPSGMRPKFYSMDDALWEQDDGPIGPSSAAAARHRRVSFL
jgi:hypothetical protein